jgi:hypothetical protein
MSVLEPYEEDLVTAAEVELIAQRAGLNLDPGESQLFAMLIQKRLAKVATGDKRAVTSLFGVLIHKGVPSLVDNQVRCLEQLALRALALGIADNLRSAVCEEAHVDKTLTICFLCKTSPWDWKETAGALVSYISDLRNCTGKILERD